MKLKQDNAQSGGAELTGLIEI